MTKGYTVPILTILVALLSLPFMLFPNSVPHPLPTSTPQSVNSAVLRLYFTPETSTLVVNSSSTLTVNLSAGSDSVSATELNIKFDPHVMKVNSLSPVNGGQFTLVLTQSSINNETGNASITLAAPPGHLFTGTGPVADITFTALTKGATSFQFASNTQVAVLGKNTNALRSTSPAAIAVE